MVFLSDGDRAEHDVKVKAEVGVRFPQTREHQGPPGAGQGEEGFSLSTFGETVALPTPWLWSSGLQSHKGINIVVLSHRGAGSTNTRGTNVRDETSVPVHQTRPTPGDRYLFLLAFISLFLNFFSKR